MFRIPEEFEIPSVIGQCASQLRVGQFDLQFTIGDIDFAIWSPIVLFRKGHETGSWNPNTWPSESFFELLNATVVNYEVPNDERLVLFFDNDIEMHLSDSSDRFESMSIGPYII